MSKMKSKFRPKAKKPTASQTWCVDVYEHEEGWGQRLEDHFEFPSEDEALEYVRKANIEFAKQGGEGSYALAHPPYKKREN